MDRPTGTKGESPSELGGTPSENVEMVGQIGGSSHAIAVQGNYAYLGVGPRLIILNISNPAHPMVVGQGPVFPGSVTGVFVAGNYAYVAAGTGGLRVVDVSDLTAPAEVGVYDTPGYAHDVYVADSYAYVADVASLRVMDVSNPTAPQQVGFYDLPRGDSFGMGAYGIYVAGAYAYVAAGWDGLRVVDVSDPTAPHEVSFHPPGSARDVWVAGAYAYVAAGEFGLRVMDVSDPTAPQEVGRYDSSDDSFDIYDVYVVGTYAYVAYNAGIEGGLRVVDVADPTVPLEVGAYDTPWGADGIYVAGTYAYIAAEFYGLWVVDLSDPAAPLGVGSYNMPGAVWDVYVVDTYAYAGDLDGLWTMDVSDPAAPVEVGYYDAPDQGDFSWVYGIYVAGTYAYVAAGSSGLRVVDISDPAAPREVGYYNAPEAAVGVYVVGTYAYVATWVDGLRVVDISDPTAPAEVGVYDTPGYAFDVQVVGAYAYVADSGAGLRVIDVSDPAAPQEVGFYDTPAGWAHGLSIANGYAYVVDGGGGLRVIDVSNPHAPTGIGFFNTPSDAGDVYVAGNHAYIATYDYGLRVVDVSDPAAPVEVGYYETPGWARGVYVVGPYTYVSHEDRALYILRFNNGSEPVCSTSSQVNDDVDTATQFSPDIAVDAAGNTYAVWRDERNGDSDIYFAYRPTGGAWGPNVRVNDDVGTAWQGFPALAVDDAGNAYVIWQDERNGDPDIYFAYRPSGGTWGPNVRVNDDTGVTRQEYPDIAVDGAGNAYAIWDDWRNSLLADIYFAYRPAGGDWRPNVLVSDDTRGAEQKHPAIAVDRLGNAYVVWHDYRDAHWDIYFAYWPAGGHWGSNVRVNDDTDMADQFYPDIGVDDAGNAYAVWIDKRANSRCNVPCEFDIYFAYRPAGGQWGTDVRVNDIALAAGSWSYPAIAVNGDGNAYAVWADWRNHTPDDSWSNPDIYFAYRPAGGNWRSNVRMNDDTGTARQGTPGIAVDGAGNAYIAWEDNRNGDYDIYFSSCQSTGCSPGTDGVVLYEHPNYGGRCVTITDDIPNLADIGFDDMASSIRFVGSYATGWEAVLSEHYYHSGTSSAFENDDPDLSDDEIGRARASSIQLRPLTAAIVGTVRNRHHYPIADARVRFAWLDNARVALTDREGRYELARLPSGEVGTISASKDGYEPVGHFASTPGAGGSKRYDFTLTLDSDKQRLADRFVPALSLHSEEVYQPRHVNIMVSRAALKERCHLLGDPLPVHRTVVPVGSVTIDILSFDYSGRPDCGWTVPGSEQFYFLDLPESDNSDPGAYAEAYNNAIKGEERDRYPLLTYARVVDTGELEHDHPPGAVVQYWFFYYYNPGPRSPGNGCTVLDRTNCHEGDWEQITLVFDDTVARVLASNLLPVRARYASHVGGRRVDDWSELDRTGETHPLVYVARGSHASYPDVCDEPLSSFFTDVCEKREPEDLLSPTPVLIPDTEGSHWLYYSGKWGEFVEALDAVSDIQDDGPSSLPGRDAYEDPYCWATGKLNESCLPLVRQMARNTTAQFAFEGALAVQTESNLPLEVRDSLGRQLTTGVFEIPDAMFFDYGPRDGKLAIVPNADLTQPYTILLNGATAYRSADLSSSASAVSGDLTIAFLEPEEGIPRALQYHQVTLPSSASQAEVQVQSGGDMLLNIDQDGDGHFETQRTPDVDRLVTRGYELHLPLVMRNADTSQRPTPPVRPTATPTPTSTQTPTHTLTSTPTPTPTNTPTEVPLVLNFTALLEARDNHQADITIDVRPPGDTVSLFRQTVQTNANGRYEGLVLTGLPPGPYDVYAKGPAHLARLQSVVLAEGVNDIDFSDGGTVELVAGDLNGDNRVAEIDLHVLLNAFRSPLYFPCADLNNDGAINGADVNIVLANLGASGDGGRWGALCMPPPPQLYLDPRSTSTTVSQIFTVDIVADTGAGSADRVDAYIDFDPNYLEVVDEMGQPAQAIELNMEVFGNATVNAVDNATGKIDFSAPRPDSPLSGPFTAATIRFRTKAAVDTTTIRYAQSSARTSDLYQDGEPLNAVTKDSTVSIAPPLSIEVAKTADPTSVPEPGGDVSFTVRVTNTGSMTVTLTSLLDDIHGDLNGRGNCSVPQTVAAGAAYECTFSVSLTGNAGFSETDTVTARVADDEGNTASGSDSATVSITNVLPRIEVTKTADPTSVPEPGGMVSFTVRVTNESVESVTLYSLVDDVHGNINGRGTCSVPQTMAVGSAYECSFSAEVIGNAGDSEVDTVTTRASDDEGNTAEATDSATVGVAGMITTPTPTPTSTATSTLTPTSTSSPTPTATATSTPTLSTDSQVFVDDDNCPEPGSGTQVDPYCRIQDAIRAITSGGTINIAPGEYAETITLDQAATVIGTGLDTVVRSDSATCFDTSTETGATIVDVQAANVTINGLYIDGNISTSCSGSQVPRAASGISLRSQDGFVLLRNTTIADPVYGLFVEDSMNVQVRNNTIVGAGLAGIGAGMYFSATERSVVGNVVRDSPEGVGILVANGGGGVIRENTIARVKTGLRVESTSIAVQDNAFDGSGIDDDVGIQLIQAGSTTTSSVLSRNAIEDFMIGIDVRGGGQLLQSNEIYGPGQDVEGSIGVRFSTELESSEIDGIDLASMTDNLIRDFERGIVVQEPSNDTSAFVFLLMGGSEASANTITRYRTFALQLENTNDDITAEFNDWGVTTAEQVEEVIWHQNDDPALGLVDFSPFLGQ